MTRALNFNINFDNKISIGQMSYSSSTKYSDCVLSCIIREF